MNHFLVNILLPYEAPVYDLNAEIETKYEICFFDNCQKLNCLVLIKLIFEKLAKILPQDTSYEKREFFAKKLLSKVHVFSPRSNAEFLINLKGI